MDHSSLAAESFGQLDASALGIDEVGDLQSAQLRQRAVGQIERRAGGLQLFAEGFQADDLKPDVIQCAAFGGGGGAC
jgi:hypothetical protein